MNEIKTLKRSDLQIRDPKTFGLTARYSVGLMKNDTPVLIVNRKSRIIMQDGRRLKKALEAIRLQSGKAPALALSGPICSKTLTFFRESGVSVYRLS